MVFDSAATQPSFFKNEELNGRGAMNIVIREHCSDVILAGIGEGAWGRLLAANVQAWIAPASVTGEQALQMLVRGVAASVCLPGSSRPWKPRLLFVPRRDRSFFCRLL